MRLHLDQSWLAELALIWLSEILIRRLDLHAKSLNFQPSKQNPPAQKYTSLSLSCIRITSFDAQQRTSTGSSLKSEWMRGSGFISIDGTLTAWALKPLAEETNSPSHKSRCQTPQAMINNSVKPHFLGWSITRPGQYISPLISFWLVSTVRDPYVHGAQTHTSVFQFDTAPMCLLGIELSRRRAVCQIPAATASDLQTPHLSSYIFFFDISRRRRLHEVTHLIQRDP